MKLKEKQQAIALRQGGMAITKICKQLNVSKSTVSLWVRDVKLTEQQEIFLKNKSNFNREYNDGVKADALSRRQDYQTQGRLKAKEHNLIHTQGCMLYWAEGGKGRTSVIFTNSDANMLCFFLKFLRECYNVKNNDIAISINCYTNNGLSVEEIENYWIDLLELTKENLNKTIHDNRQHRNTGQKQGKHPYGICRLAIHKVEILQSIFGAIQEYVGLDYPQWIR